MTFTLESLFLSRGELLARARRNLSHARGEWNSDDERFLRLRFAIELLKSNSEFTRQQLEDVLPWSMLGWRDEVVLEISYEFPAMVIASAEKRYNRMEKVLNKIRMGAEA